MKKGLVGCFPVAPYIMHLWGAAEKSITSLRGLLLSVKVFCLINGFAVRAGHTKGKVQHLAVVPLEAQLLLKALTEEVSEAGEKKKISVWVNSRRYEGGYLRASQVTSTTPSTSAWQQRGVSSAGQTEPGARS